MRPRAGRPLGDISRALLSAAQQSPGTVRELAQRAQVGYQYARYTATRLVQGGALCALNDGQRPALLAPTPAVQPLSEAFALLAASSFRERGR